MFSGGPIRQAGLYGYNKYLPGNLKRLSLRGSLKNKVKNEDVKLLFDLNT